MNAPGDPFDRVVPRGPVSHPPCPQRCWEAVGEGWRFVKPHGLCCQWESEQFRWTRCKENQQ